MRALAVAKSAGNDAIYDRPQQRPENPWVLGRRSLGRRSSTSRRRSQRRLPASRCDGASATADTAAVTSNAARKRERTGAGTRPFASLLRTGSQPHGVPGSTSIVLAEREANAKWLRVRPPVTETKQHVRCYAQSVTDEPFLNRVSHANPGGGATIQAKVSARQPSFGGSHPGEDWPMSPRAPSPEPTRSRPGCIRSAGAAGVGPSSSSSSDCK